MVLMPARFACGAGHRQNATTCVDDHGLGLGIGTAYVDVDVVVAQAGVAVYRQDMIGEHLRVVILGFGFGFDVGDLGGLLWAREGEGYDKGEGGGPEIDRLHHYLIYIKLNNGFNIIFF